MTAPPSLGSLLRWISHQRAMSCRTRLRVDCDLGTLPVNVRTSRVPSLSVIRQCRKATSKGSSFLSEKSTLNLGLGLVSLILLTLCVRSPWSVYHSHWWTSLSGRRTTRSRSIFPTWLPLPAAYLRVPGLQAFKENLTELLVCIRNPWLA